METNGKEITIEIPALNLAGRLWGPCDGPPVMALHGWLDNAGSFDVLAQGLSELDIFAMDFAGHGHLDPRSADVGYWGWLDIQDVLAVADALGWGRFTILAHSMGAEYSTQLVALYPERVDVQICIDGWVEATPLSNVLDAVRENLDTCLQTSTGNLRVFASLADMAERLVEAKAIDYSGAMKLVKRGHKKVPDGYVWSTERRIRATHTQRHSDEVVLAFAERTRAPTLLIRGSDGEHWFDHSIELVRNVLPVFEELVIEGPHHLHMGEAVPEIVAEVTDFLERNS